MTKKSFLEVLEDEANKIGIYDILPILRLQLEHETFRHLMSIIQKAADAYAEQSLKQTT
jgi:uncharacterized protein (UPF0305 family)